MQLCHTCGGKTKRSCLKAVAVLWHKSTVIGGFRGVLFLLLRFQALVSLPHAINFAQDCNLCAVFSTTVNINNLIEKRIKML